MTIRQPPVSERPASDLKARTLGAARAIPSPTRGTQAKRATILLSGALVAAAIIFFWMGGIRVTGRPSASSWGLRSVRGWSLRFAHGQRLAEKNR